MQHGDIVPKLIVEGLARKRRRRNPGQRSVPSLLGPQAMHGSHESCRIQKRDAIESASKYRNLVGCPANEQP